VWGGLWWYQIEREQTKIETFKETSVGLVVDIDFFRTSSITYITFKLDTGDVVYGELMKYHYVDVGVLVNVTHSMKKIIDLKVLVARETEPTGGTTS